MKPASSKVKPASAEMQPVFLVVATSPYLSIKVSVQGHNSTLILIESGYCYFYQKLQYFWAFQRFKADLGYSRDRPFLRL